MARDYQQKYEQAVADLDKRNSSLNDLYSQFDEVYQFSSTLQEKLDEMEGEKEKMQKEVQQHEKASLVTKLDKEKQEALATQLQVELSNLKIRFEKLEQEYSTAQKEMKIVKDITSLIDVEKEQIALEKEEVEKAKLNIAKVLQVKNSEAQSQAKVIKGLNKQLEESLLSQVKAEQLSKQLQERLQKPKELASNG